MEQFEPLLFRIFPLKTMYNQFCCDILTENILEAGRKGFSIIPCRIETEDSYYFVLQFRSSDETGHNNQHLFIGQRAIMYCPWCGTKLSDLVTSHKKRIETLANAYQHLVR